MFSPLMLSEVSTMSTTWCRRSTRRCAIQSPGSGEGLAEHVVQRGLHVELAGPRLAQRLAHRLRRRPERADEPGGALQHGARRQPLGVVAQARVGDAAVAAREVHGDRPAVEGLLVDAVALGEGRQRRVAGRRLRGARRQAADFYAASGAGAEPRRMASGFWGPPRGARGRRPGPRRARRRAPGARRARCRSRRRCRRAGRRASSGRPRPRGAAPRGSRRRRRRGRRPTAARRSRRWRWRRARTRPCESAGAAASPA